MLHYLNVRISLSLPCIIVHKDDARKNKRPRANNTLLLPKRMRIKFVLSLAFTIAR